MSEVEKIEFKVKRSGCPMPEPKSPKNYASSDSKPPMKNITINIPDIYDENIQKLIKLKVTPSRSEAIRTALRDFLHEEYKHLELYGYFEDDETDVKLEELSELKPRERELMNKRLYAK